MCDCLKVTHKSTSSHLFMSALLIGRGPLAALLHTAAQRALYRSHAINSQAVSQGSGGRDDGTMTRLRQKLPQYNPVSVKRWIGYSCKQKEKPCVFTVPCVIKPWREAHGTEYAKSLNNIAVMELCVTGVNTLLTFVSLLSSLYSVSSVFPKSEFLIMPNMSPGHLSSLRSFGFVVRPPFKKKKKRKTTFSLVCRPQLLKKQKTKQEITFF